MANDNQISVVGNATGTPELRFSTKGNAVARFSVAQNQRIRLDDGTWDDGDTTFARCVAFGSLAENLAESIDKGTRVIVIGRLHQDDWKPEPTDEDPDPKVRTNYEIIVDSAGPELRWASATVVKAARTGPAFDPDADEAKTTAAKKANGTNKAAAKVPAGEEDF